MSTTYSLVCDDCRLSKWAGQRDYIYGTPDVAAFLYAHLGHRLRFLNDHVEDPLADDYAEVDDPGTD